MSVYDATFKPIETLLGGYHHSYLYNFYGRTSSGKTTLSTYLPILAISKSIDLENAKENGERFFVVSVDKSFKWERMSEILTNNDIDPSVVQELLFTFEPTSFTNQNTIIMNQIPNIIRKENYAPLLISIDSLTEKYREEFCAAKRSERQVTALDNMGVLEKQLNFLKDYALERDIVVNISCQMASPMTLEKAQTWRDELIGGNPVKFIPDIVVKLEDISEREKVIRATLVKSRTEKEGRRVLYSFTSNGIKEVE